MSSQLSIPIPVNKLSAQMCAVLRVITADQTLSDTVFKFVDIQKDTVDWESIHKLSFSPGHRAALQFAFITWTDRMEASSERLFADALNMESELKRACLKALALRWGI